MSLGLVVSPTGDIALLKWELGAKITLSAYVLATLWHSTWLGLAELLHKHH